MHSLQDHWNLRIRYPPNNVPNAAPGTTTPVYKLESLELKLYWDSINLGKNAAPLKPKASAVTAMVAKRKTLFFKIDFKIGKNSFNVRGFSSSGTESFASFFAAFSASMFGRWSGKPNKGTAAMRDRTPPKTYPNHQAPTQELSFGVMFTFSGCKNEKNEEF